MKHVHVALKKVTKIQKVRIMTKTLKHYKVQILIHLFNVQFSFEEFQNQTHRPT